MEIDTEIDTRKGELECFDDLNYYVIKKGLCTSCGTCAGICPHIEFKENLPFRSGPHDSYCGSCIQFCPQFYIPFSKIEKKVFGTTRDDRHLGYYESIVSARATSESILKVCQDGGVASTLAQYLLSSGRVEGVLMAGLSETEPLKPVPMLVTKPEDVTKAAGSKYSMCPVMMSLREAFEKGIRNIAIVGSACQVQGMRKFELFSEEHYPFDIKAVIGIFCYDNFVYDDLFKGFVEGELGIKLEDIKSVKIRHNAFELYRSREMDSIPLKTIYKHVNKPCTLCRDFTAELADISVGAVGSSLGWNTVMVRSSKGRELFDELVENNLILLSKQKTDLNYLRRVARRKKEHVEKISPETTELLTQFGLSEFEVKVYEFLIALHGPRLETLNEVMHVSPDEIKNALETLKQRGWVREIVGKYTLSHKYIPEKPETVINNEMKKLNEKLRQLKKSALSELNASYVRKISETDLLKGEV